jgi:hypothetical protein
MMPLGIRCSGLDAIDDQGVPGIVAALKANHALGAFGQPVDQLAFAFIAPLGAHDDDVASFGCIHWDVSQMACTTHCPAA